MLASFGAKGKGRKYALGNALRLWQLLVCV